MSTHETVANYIDDVIDIRIENINDLARYIEEVAVPYTIVFVDGATTEERAHIYKDTANYVAVTVDHDKDGYFAVWTEYTIEPDGELIVVNQGGNDLPAAVDDIANYLKN